MWLKFTYDVITIAVANIFFSTMPNTHPSLANKQHCLPKQWHSTLDLTFSHRQHKTVLTHRKHTGALRVQKPLYPEPAKQQHICHVLPLYPPAGIASGDKLSFNINLEPKSHCVITSPGANKWYGGKQLARQMININIGENAILEWLPQEAIVFNNAKVQAKTHITLHPTASILVWEITVFGRKAFKEHFLFGNYHNEVSITQVDVSQKTNVLIHDLLNVSADNRWFYSPLGMNGQHVLANFWAVPPVNKRDTLATTIEAMRDYITKHHLPVVVTQIQTLLVIRYIGADVQCCFKAMTQVRAFLRNTWWGYNEHYPRIWDT